MNKEEKYLGNIQVKEECEYSTDEFDIDIGSIKVDLDIGPEVLQTNSTNYEDLENTGYIKDLKDITKKNKNHSQKRSDKTELKNVTLDELDVDIGTIKVDLKFDPHIFYADAKNTVQSVKPISKHTSKYITKGRKHNKQKKAKRSQNKKEIDNDSDEETLYLCETCNQFFTFWRQLKQHEYTHTNKGAHKYKNEFSCEICKKTFSFKCNLKRHMKVHGLFKDDAQLFCCAYCDKKFKRKYILVDHIRSHTGVRPYSCNRCKLKFTTKGGLVQHNEVHTSKTFECNECGKQFRRKFNLIQHIRIHNNERPYKCTKCKKRFGYKYMIKTHLCS